MINVGSVGQPRDGDWRSCYVIHDGESISFRRVEYDVERTVQQIEAVEELDELFEKDFQKGWNLMQVFCDENNLRLSVFLPTGLYGPAILPEHLKHNPFLWIKSVLEGGPPRHQKVPNDSASLIHLQDLAKLFLAAYENPSASGRYFGVLESFHWNDIYKECQRLIPDMQMPEAISEDPVAPTQFDFKRRDSLGVKIRDFPTIMHETVEWIKSKPF